MTALYLILFFALLIGIDFYVWSGLQSVFSERFRPRWRVFFWTASILMMVLLTVALVMLAFRLGGFFFRVTVMAAWVSLLVPKLIFAVVLLIEDLTRWIRGFLRMWAPISGSRRPFLVSRRKFVAQIGILTASIPFGFVVHGLTRGKYNFTVHRMSVPVVNLPDAFDGFTITQISDLHVGSFDDRDEVLRGLDLVNDQRSDLLVFTGDLVNYRVTELEGWVDMLRDLEASSGKISILGNHDYGDYVRWTSEDEKSRNFDALVRAHGEMGFQLLLNEHMTIEKQGSGLTVIGVENWGTPPFRQRGDLDQAIAGANTAQPKILLTHDPMHWDRIVKTFPESVDLTLSGHTHGFQFGVEIPGFRWSPVQYRYPQWAGLYEENGRYINVNRGFGFIGIPGRVGIWPEISVITLRKT